MDLNSTTLKELIVKATGKPPVNPTLAYSGGGVTHIKDGTNLFGIWVIPASNQWTETPKYWFGFGKGHIINDAFPIDETTYNALYL